jgi:hypothetical protein
MPLAGAAVCASAGVADVATNAAAKAAKRRTAPIVMPALLLSVIARSEATKQSSPCFSAFRIASLRSQ